MPELKLAVFFPGIGYHCDKPLLYYSEKLAKQYQYETIKIKYEGLSKDLDEAFTGALAQTEACLAEVDWKQYEEILFCIEKHWDGSRLRLCRQICCEL